MKIRGKLAGVSKDWKSGRYQITFDMAEGNLEELDEIKDQDLQINIDKYSEKRSGKANRLLWECLGQIATFEKKTKWAEYLKYLKLFGKYTFVIVKPTAVEALKRQWRETEELGPIDINGQQAIQMICYYGSSTYTSREFAKFLDLIIEDMADLGLPKPTSQELERAIKELEEAECRALSKAKKDAQNAEQE